MTSRIGRKIGHGPKLVFGLIAFCLLSFAGYADDDPLFGDLPSRLEVVDDVLQNVGASERFGDLIQGLSNRISLESSISGLSPGGFSYEIGPLGLPEKTSANLGTVWTQGADPLGSGRLSIGLNYTYLKFDRFEGRSLDDFLDFEDSNPAIDIQLELTTQILGVSALYGLTEDWEIGCFVPWVAHESRGKIYLGNDLVGDANGRTEGLGDILLLTKYRLLNRQHWSWSVTGRLKTPTGDEDKYLGTGRVDGGVLTVLSYSREDLKANFELGYTWNSRGSEYDVLTYRAGLAYGVSESFTLVGELLGSYSRESVFDTLDAGLGLKYNPTGGVVIQAGVRIPLDADDGLRADFAPTVGLEWRF